MVREHGEGGMEDDAEEKKKETERKREGDVEWVGRWEEQRAGGSNQREKGKAASI